MQDKSAKITVFRSWQQTELVSVFRPVVSDVTLISIFI